MNPCARQGRHIFLPTELGILRAGDPCVCGAARWQVEDVPVPVRRGVPILNLVGQSPSYSWSAEQERRNIDAADLLLQAAPSNQWEEDFVANLTEWVDTGKPVTEKQLDKLRQVVNGGYEHYIDSEGYF